MKSEKFPHRDRRIALRVSLESMRNLQDPQHVLSVRPVNILQLKGGYRLHLVIHVAQENTPQLRELYRLTVALIVTVEHMQKFPVALASHVSPENIRQWEPLNAMIVQLESIRQYMLIYAPGVSVEHIPKLSDPRRRPPASTVSLASIPQFLELTRLPRAWIVKPAPFPARA